MHTFHDWQRWQRPICIISTTSMKKYALTNVDKCWQIWENPEIHSQVLTKHNTYIIPTFLIKEKDKILYNSYLQTMFLVCLCSCHLCQRCQPWNIYHSHFSRSVFTAYPHLAGNRNESRSTKSVIFQWTPSSSNI